MARAIEKGATYLDKLCHKFYDEPKGRGKKTDYVCRLCGGPLETYYCEERLYLVKCTDCGTLALVKTVNPEASASVTLARPTLTPPNEWVAVEKRLPEPEFAGQQRGFYLVALSNGVVKELMYEFRHYENMMFDVGWHETAYPVTHWMPIPAPPDRRPPEGEEDT